MDKDIEELLNAITIGPPIIATPEEREASREYNKKLSEQLNGIILDDE